MGSDIVPNMEGIGKMAQAFARAYCISDSATLNLINQRAKELQVTLHMVTSLTKYAQHKVREDIHKANLAFILSCLKTSILWVTNEHDNPSTMRKLMKLAKKIHKKLPMKLESFELVYDASLNDLQEALKEIKEQVTGVKDDGGGMICLAHQARATAFHAYSNNLKAQFGTEQIMFNSSDEDWDRFFLQHSLWKKAKVVVDKDSSDDDEEEDDDEDDKITLVALKECGGSFQAAKAKLKRQIGKENKKLAAKVTTKVEKRSAAVVGRPFAMALNKDGQKVRVNNPYYKF